MSVGVAVGAGGSEPLPHAERITPAAITRARRLSQRGVPVIERPPSYLDAAADPTVVAPAHSHRAGYRAATDRQVSVVSRRRAAPRGGSRERRQARRAARRCRDLMPPSATPAGRQHGARRACGSSGITRDSSPSALGGSSVTGRGPHLSRLMLCPLSYRRARGAGFGMARARGEAGRVRRCPAALDPHLSRLMFCLLSSPRARGPVQERYDRARGPDDAGVPARPPRT